jgi:hypothetical protein
MDMLKGDQIAEANLTDWRKLAQGLHARCLVGDFGTGARFVAAVGEAGDALGHHPRVSIGNGYDRQPRNLLPGDAGAARQLTRRFTRTRLVVGAGAGPAGRASGNRPRSPGVSGFGKDQSTVGRVWTKARRDGTGVADPAEPLRAASQRIDAVHASVGQAGFPHDRG